MNKNNTTGDEEEEKKNNDKLRQTVCETETMEIQQIINSGKEKYISMYVYILTNTNIVSLSCSQCGAGGRMVVNVRRGRKGKKRKENGGVGSGILRNDDEMTQPTNRASKQANHQYFADKKKNDYRM
jgi:hypothetical protein